MTTTLYVTTPSEGVNFNTTYTAYDQTAAISATNSPDNPGPPFSVGTIMNGTGDSQFIFVKATAAIAAADVCLISKTNTAAGITTTNATYGALVGVAVVAIASGSYGWLQRSGQCGGIKTAAAVVINVRLAATATAGAIDDVVTTGTKNITGIVVTTTATSAMSVAGILNYPIVGTTN